MLYEDPTKDVTSDERFHVELHFSPGVNCCVQKEVIPGPGFRPHSRSKGNCRNGNSDESGSGGGGGLPCKKEDNLVCSVKCSAETVGKMFGKQSFPDIMAFDEDQLNTTPAPLEDVEEMDEDFQTNAGDSKTLEATSDPIEIRVSRLNSRTDADCEEQFQVNA